MPVPADEAQVVTEAVSMRSSKVRPQSARRVGSMAATASQSVTDIQSFINDYFGAWEGTDQDRIMSYYAENVTVQIPGTLMQGRSALREQFVRPFITAFPGNRHVVKNWIFGTDVVVVEWS